MANLFVPSSLTDAEIANLATMIFENHGEEIGNAATKKNFFMAVLEKFGSKKVVDGGLDFAEPVLKTADSNFDFRGKFDGIDSNYQDYMREFKFEPKVLDGVIALNDLDLAMNDGSSAIKKLMNVARLSADTAIKNKLNDALWVATPTSVQPESIRSIVSTTPTTGSLGGITRAGNTFAQNGVYTTAITDIGSEAGLATLHGERMNMGGDAGTNPDIGVTTTTLLGGLYGYLDNLRRLRADEDMAKLKLDNLYVGTALVGADTECPASQFYYINSNHIFLKILRKMNFVFDPFSKKANDLKITSVFKLAYNLTTNLPSAHKVFTNVSTS